MRHLKNIAANGLRLAALFGINAWKSTGGVDKGEYRQLELLCRLHQAQGFAVTLWTGHAEVTRCAFFGVTPFLLANDHASIAIEASQTAHNAQVVREMPVAMHLHKVGEYFVDIVKGIGALRVTGNLGDLPRREVTVDVFGELLAFFGELVYFI